MHGDFEGLPSGEERYDGVFVDHDANDVVMVYPGDRIRALPRAARSATG